MSVARKCMIAISPYGEDSDEIPTISALMELSDDGSPHIVELTVRASNDGSISAQAARDIDFESLARAFSGVVAATKPSDEPESRRRSPREEALPSRAGATERPYRKMPDAQQVRDLFLETGSVGKVARHFGVPRYTAQAWVDRLRRMGEIEAIRREA